jgi:hypothetical protein
MTAAARLVAAAFVAGALAGQARGADRGRRAAADYVSDPPNVRREAAELDATQEAATRDVDARDATAPGDTARRG